MVERGKKKKKKKSERLMNRRLGKWSHPDQPNLHSHTEAPSASGDINGSRIHRHAHRTCGPMASAIALPKAAYRKASVSGSGIAPVDCMDCIQKCPADEEDISNDRSNGITQSEMHYVTVRAYLGTA